jgi:hypothetical protein
MRILGKMRFHDPIDGMPYGPLLRQQLQDTMFDLLKDIGRSIGRV